MPDQDEKKGFGFNPDGVEEKRRKLQRKLALYLREKFTHEDLASSMAHLMLERSDFREASIKAAAEIAKEAAQSVVTQAISALNKHHKEPRQENYKVTLGPLAERSAAAQKAAEDIAQKCWGANPSARIGDVAEEVYRTLVRTEHKAALPGNVERIRKWIRGVAPATASRPGRPSKKTP